jgi:serine protease Do
MNENHVFTVQPTEESMVSRKTILSTLLLVGAVSLLVSIAGSAIVCAFVFERYVQKLSAQQESPVAREVVRLQDDNIVAMVENVSPAVVSIVATKEVPQYQQLFRNSPLNLFFGVPNQQQEQQQNVPSEKQKVGGGTGFFISADGMIVTNRHVVADTDAEYTVFLSDGSEHVATVLARDEYLDFAVLKIDGDNFTAVDLGNSDDIKIGQTVVAIGNSLGEFSNSVSRGIISGMQRNIVAGGGFGGAEELTNIIQTDAAINFGNSGGPLLDVNGKVIGINTAVAQGAENIGFAIPISQVTRLIDEVKNNGKISRPFVGVRYVDMTDEIRKALNVSYDHGVLIVRGDRITDFAVLPGSPADKAGLVENDIILEIEGVKIDKMHSLTEQINHYKVGDSVALKIWHKGEERDVKILLEDKATQNQK